MSGPRHAVVQEELCLHCGFCADYVDCPAPAGCIGCGLCVKGCPQGARSLRPVAHPRSEETRFVVDGTSVVVAGGSSVRDALRRLGIEAGENRGATDGGNGASCDTGGCWSCAVLIDGLPARSCVTPVRDGMEIVTAAEALRLTEPRRLVTVMRPYPHRHPSVFAHGCNYHCGACHNWEMTFASCGNVLTPQETAAALRIDVQEDYWVGISGGEPTLTGAGS